MQFITEDKTFSLKPWNRSAMQHLNSYLFTQRMNTMAAAALIYHLYDI